MFGVEIDEEHHVSRYCKSRFIDEGLPISDAFKLRDKEEYLSVNWLEYFNTPNIVQAIDCVRQVFRDKGYSIGREGRFVSLKVRKIKNVILKHSDRPARVMHLPTKKDPSHCGVFGYTGHISTDKLIALKIAKIAHASDVYLGKIL